MALLNQENLKIRDTILDFEKRIEKMHLDFQKYRVEEEYRVPEWEKFERELFGFSRKKIFDLELSKQLDRVMLKFQNRKKIWINWVEEFHRRLK